MWFEGDNAMRHTIEITEEAYQALLALAREQGNTPDAVVEAWATQHALAQTSKARDPRVDPHYYTTDEWFRHLGMTDEQIRRAEDDAEAADDADA
jgi:hypothetical protein